MSVIYKDVELIDGKENLTFTVTPEDFREGKPLNAAECAGAIAIRRLGFVQARVYRRAVHVQKVCGGPVYRYIPNDATRVIETLNDLKAVPDKAIRITLYPPKGRATLAKCRAADRRHRKALKEGKAKKHKRKRKAPSSLESLGIRAPAARSQAWG